MEFFRDGKDTSKNFIKELDLRNMINGNEVDNDILGWAILRKILLNL